MCGISNRKIKYVHPFKFCKQRLISHTKTNTFWTLTTQEHTVPCHSKPRNHCTYQGIKSVTQTPGILRSKQNIFFIYLYWIINKHLSFTTMHFSVHIFISAEETSVNAFPQMYKRNGFDTQFSPSDLTIAVSLAQN
jgi:hypothetical protein